ncbi:conjugal transfer protein TraM [Rhizobium sp. LCM 4573]|uniref:conjugal transfer protein TraM n=1 Tax=Rhizobium sp. LCM 4573 TaxID=1848291 RepID=UPI0008DA70B2|nr:conjugal transfer protein TraM [Rhizobium sp. LCM 4573]OHV78272.1 conjugal transfer protein TraM [Rhizobium sp. LCM 4573]
MIDFDELRKEVAIRHNVLIGKDDPILVTVTVNEMVVGRLVDRVSEQYDEHSRALTIAMQQHVEQAKDTAGKVITDAAGYVRAEVKKAVVEALADAGTGLQRQIGDALAAGREAASSGRDAQTAKNGAFLAACVASVCALLSVGALVVVLLR